MEKPPYKLVVVSDLHLSEGWDEDVNSGSWTKSFAVNHEEALLKEENEFVYVHIGYGEKKKTIKLDLLRWADSLHEGERVKLFRSKKRTQ